MKLPRSHLIVFAFLTIFSGCLKPPSGPNMLPKCARDLAEMLTIIGSSEFFRTLRIPLLYMQQRRTNLGFAFQLIVEYGGRQFVALNTDSYHPISSNLRLPGSMKNLFDLCEQPWLQICGKHRLPMAARLSKRSNVTHRWMNMKPTLRMAKRI